ncbi:hypothetical protein FRC0191_01871 [Corynebacterium diphtheriae]|uniref:helix-turn-helix transcriptional regulator n=1 Tax=Corynebacterium diphtheriae TaxID=1717 RepID=UPI0013CBBE25|nr:hypothetical protein CIP107577_01953 [Corynebacterium diphtheriae]CAB0811985.1 hypothetical protein FRC0191_01871 [Corynebacterium diphtheriae]
MKTTLSVPAAAQLLGISEGGAYKAIRAGQFPVPVLKIGRARYVVPVAPLLEALGLDQLPPIPTEEPEPIAA